MGGCKDKTHRHGCEDRFLPELGAFQRRMTPAVVMIKENAGNAPSCSRLICSDSIVLGMILWDAV